MTKLKTLELILTILVIFTGVFLLNVYAHEMGHFVTADILGLKPQITMEPLKENLDFSMESKPLAYTEFDKTESKTQMIFIAIAGPLVNLLIAMIFLIIYINYRHNARIQNIALAGLFPSIFSFIINIIPYSTTDGMMILQSII